VPLMIPTHNRYLGLLPRRPSDSLHKVLSGVCLRSRIGDALHPVEVPIQSGVVNKTRTLALTVVTR
jgi:hypothetical protein